MVQAGRASGQLNYVFFLKKFVWLNPDYQSDQATTPEKEKRKTGKKKKEKGRLKDKE
jgi:hypothetical protein